MKSPNLDELSEEELKEYLAQNADEDLKADLDGGVVEKEEPQVQIAEEVELPAPKKRLKQATAEEKEKKRQEKIRERAIKKRRRYLRKNSSTLVRYDIDPKLGLTDEIAEQRMVDELYNRTKSKSNRSVFSIVVKNIFTFFNILIFAIAGFLMWVGAPVTDFVFLVIVSINIIIGIIQEINAKNMIDKLSLMSAPTAFVIRSGVEHEISIEDVVLDDCLLLESGRQICADSIVIDGAIEVNESLLTGESDAILKKPGDVLYSGSYVVSGKCAARVDKVGKDNYIEKLSQEAKKYKKPKSDLYSALNSIIKFMAFPVVIFGGLLFYIMFFRNKIELYDTARQTAGAMIGMIPSGLFLMSTIALYIGVIKLGQKNVLVQDVYCVEMLARVNCICLDKTGTITDGTMVVKNVIDYNNVHGLATRNIVSAMLNALQDNNMTSQALKEKFGLGKRIKHTATIPFSSSRKFQAVTFDKYGTFALGAPEFVLKADYKRVEKDVNKYAALGYRVLCLAHKDGTINGVELPEGPIEIIAMILIEDNIRPDAINTIRYFRESGVEVRVISGDNPITVSKIAARAGVDAADKYVSLDGKLDSDVVNEVRKGTTVFGRVSPQQKKLIIQTLKELGKTVAMTGDGVNDILALKEADCSIAVASGSQAVRSCSHLVLLDSNFDSMPSVVSEGRRVINNVAKVSALFLTKTIFSLFLAIEALVIGGYYPIATSQLIIIETFAIGLPSIVLVNEPNNRPVKGRFLANVIRESLPGAIVILALSAVVFALSTQLGLDLATRKTIIVIAATHTCMMVLFKVCRPFTTIHKVLCGFCYSMFLFIILILPQMVGIRPVISLTEYTTEKENEQLPYVNTYPSIEASKANYYVINGKVYNGEHGTVNLFKDTTSTQELRAEIVDSKLYYTLDGRNTLIELEIPQLSYSEDGKVYLGGYPVRNTGLAYNGEFTIDTEGKLYSNGKPVEIILSKSNERYDYSRKYDQYNEKNAIFQYTILPKVTIDVENREYLIDGKRPLDGAKYQVPISFSTSTELKVTINTSTMALLVNGEEIYATDTKTGELLEEPYRVTMPKITTTCDNSIRIDAVETGNNIFDIYGTDTDFVSAVDDEKTIFDENGKAISYSSLAKSYYVDGALVDGYAFDKIEEFGFKSYKTEAGDEIDVAKLAVSALNGALTYSIVNGATNIPTAASLSNTIYSPEIEITEANKYIIDGYYTKYEFSNSALNPRVDENNYLILGNVTTDYQISQNHVSYSKVITALPLNSLIFLLFLCAVAGPIMRLLQNMIPWIIKQIKLIRSLLIKIQ